MARKTRRNSRSGIFSTIWSPIKHLFMASGESAQKLGSTAGKIVKESMKGVEGVGSAFARHSNQAVGSVGRGVGKLGRGVGKIGRGVGNLAKKALGTRKSRK
jgi:hypothetical protein